MKNPENLLYNEPFIVCYEKVATQTECRQLIDIAQNNLQPSKIIGQSGLGISTVRKSDTTWLQRHLNELILQICERITSVVGYLLNYAEQLQIARYQVGGKFDAHFDAFNPLTSLGKRQLSKSGL
ncbi:hypothetical protein ACEOWJ_002067 [Bacillus cereus]|uniref:hypothetical protein n=1 Tax=Bacillus TaxID=1386 RepID=UPI0012DFF76E|nr:hypothetical protein [Bacillus sp. UNC322MFChir4.1]